MKIGVGTLQDEFELSGEYQAFRGWTERLSGEVAALCFSPQGERLRGEGLVRLKSGEHVLGTWFAQWAFIHQALLVAKKVDSLHLFLPNPLFLWIADRVKAGCALPIAVTCLGERPAIPVSRLAGLLKQSWRFHGVRFLADRVLPSSRFLCDRYLVGSAFLARQLEEAGCPAGKLVVSAHYLPAEPESDPFSVKLAEEISTSPTFVYLGHFLPNKGVEVLLEAFAGLDGGSARLLLVWSGLGDRARIERAARRLKIESKVRIVERAIHRTAVFSKASALVLPAVVSYGQVSPPLAVEEAFRCGVPVIVSDFPALAEYGDDGAALLRVPPGQAGPLTQAMAWILAHPGPAEEMRDRQRRVHAERSAAFDASAFYGSLAHG